MWKNETLWLSERRCIYWEEERMLIISDPHFGKTGHFRKSGIYIPQQSFKADLHRLLEIIQFFKPVTLLINGDLFHSSLNREMLYFKRWRDAINQVEIILIRGNHDRFPAAFYSDLNIMVSEELWYKNKFLFVHDAPPGMQINPDSYVFMGHIHPGIRMSGTGKQSLMIPCFYFGEEKAILPAFGNFTGLAAIRPAENDLIFGIAGREVIKLK